MTELLTAAQMRAVEAAAIARGEVTGLELMERAGRGVVEAIFAEWPELARPGGGAAPMPPGCLGQDEGKRRAVVLCGPGNNGGDGFVVARLLKEHGWEVEVFLYGDPEKLPPDARVNYERWRGVGEVRRLGGRVPPLFQADVLVDALFGTGLARPLADLESVTAAIYEAEHNVFCGPRSPGVDHVVAVDLPSGTCSDSGQWLANADHDEFVADLTVTFGHMKLAHALDPWRMGKVVVVDIGLGSAMWLRDVGPVATMASAMVHKLAKVDGHKYTHGHALILSGPPDRTGAARLAARGALRIGAGLVTVGAAPEAIPEHAAQLTAIMLRPIGSGFDLGEVLADKRINALCLGPGLGLDDGARDLVAAALAWHLPDGLPLIDASDAQVGAWMREHGHRPAVVLDADALTILARDPDLFAMLHDRCVLTPHAGEFARLFPGIAEKLAAPASKGPAYSKVDATREAAARAGCVVLYKGPDTVIADPSGRCAINSAHYDRAAPWLATAGSGDVLAGFIAGLLARGFAPMQAAETAAWLHVEAARSFGPGLMAEDLPEELPKVFRGLAI